MEFEGLLFWYLLVQGSLLIVNSFLFFFLMKKKKSKDKTVLEHFLENEDPKQSLFIFAISHIIPLVLALVITFSLIYEMLIHKREKESEEKNKEKVTFSSFYSKPHEWNNLYFCSECHLHSRHYQLVDTSKLKFENYCPFCKSEETLTFELAGKSKSLDNLPFANAIEENRIKEHMIETSSKWKDLEEKEREFESKKLALKIELQQLKAYEDLHSQDLSEKITLYEKRIHENTEEMKRLKEDLMKNFTS